MRAPLLAVVLVATCLARASGDEPAPEDLSEPASWPAGVTLTFRGKKEEATGVRRPGGRGPDASYAVERTETRTVVSLCLEVDGEGLPIRRRVHLPAWRSEAEDHLDASAEGALLEVFGRGLERRFVVVAAPSLLTERARESLEEEFGPELDSRDPFRVAGGYPQAVRVGEEWDGDPAPFLREAAERLALDLSRARCRFEFPGIEGGIAQVRMELTVPAARFPGFSTRAGSDAAWQGTLRARGVRRWQRGSAHRSADSLLHASLASECRASGRLVLEARYDGLEWERTEEEGVVPTAEAARGPAGLAPGPLLDRLRPWVRALRTPERPDGAEGGGTGFLVAPDRILTCAHVVEGVAGLAVRLEGGRRVPAAGVLAADAGSDLALLQLGEACPVDGPAPLLREEPIGPAEPVAAVGFREDGTLGVQAATVSSAESGVLWVDPGMGPGASGSVLVDAEGRVAGVLAARTPGGRGIAVPAAWVRRLLDEGAAGRRLAPFSGEARIGAERRADRLLRDGLGALWRGRVRVALGTFGRVDPGVLSHPDARVLLGQSLSLFGRFEEAERLLASAERDRPLTAAHRQASAQVHLLRARGKQAWGLSARALAEWREALRHLPASPEVHRVRVELGLGAGDPRAVLPFLAFLRRGGGAESDLRQDVALALSAAGHSREAVDTVRALVEDLPGDASAWGLLATLAVHLAEPDLAWHAAVQALAHDPSLADPWFVLGWIAAEAGREAQGLEEYRRGLARDPTDATALLAAGLLAHRTGDALAAEAFLARLEGIDGEKAGRLRAALGK